MLSNLKITYNSYIALPQASPVLDMDGGEAYS